MVCEDLFRAYETIPLILYVTYASKSNETILVGSRLLFTEVKLDEIIYLCTNIMYQMTL